MVKLIKTGVYYSEGKIVKEAHAFMTSDKKEKAVKNPVSDSTVNLKCPLVIHPETRQARQVIMERYEMRHPLAEFGRGEEAATC